MSEGRASVMGAYEEARVAGVKGMGKRYGK